MFESETQLLSGVMCQCYEWRLKKRESEPGCYCVKVRKMWDHQLMEGGR